MKYSEENLVYLIGKHYKKEKSKKIICGEENNEKGKVTMMRLFL